MKRFLFLFLLGLGALGSAQGQSTPNGIMLRDFYRERLGPPPAGAALVLDGKIYGVRWIDTTKRPWMPMMRLPSGADSTLAGAATLDGSQYVKQQGDAALKNVTITSSLNYKNPGGFLPPELADPDPGWVQAYSEGSQTKGDGRRIDAAKLGLRAVSTAPVHSTDPGKHGDFFVDKTGMKKFEYLRNFDGTAQWGRIDGYITNFNLPSGLPSAPILTASFNAGAAQNFLSWSVAALATEYELHRSIGANAWGILPNDNPTTRTYTDQLSGLPAGTVVYYRVRGVNGRGTGPFSNQIAVTVPSAPVAGTPQRQLIWNELAGASVENVNVFTNKPYVTGVKFDLRWCELQSAPGVWIPAQRDSLLAALARLKVLGKKAEFGVYPHRRAYNDATPQDYLQFFPESALQRYQDGSLYQWEGGWVANHSSVQPSFSSPEGVAAVRRFYKELTQLCASYVADGTLIAVYAITGKEGEMSYPFFPQSTPKKTADYSAAALSDFRGWLQSKYGQIGSLNGAWGTSHASFSGINWPTPNVDEFGITTEPLRDWQRFRLLRLTEFYNQCRAGVREASATLPVLSMTSGLGGGYQHVVAFAGTNVALYAANNMDGTYNTSGGYTTIWRDKLHPIDVAYGTLGNAARVAIEFDTDDMDEFDRTGNTGATFGKVNVLYDVGKKAFERGAWVIHLTQIAGTWPWATVGPVAQQLYDEYIAGGQAVSTRQPEAGATYTYSAQLTTDGNAQITAWNSVGGSATKIVNVRQIDDFTGVAIEQPTAPVPPVLLPVGYETTGGGVARVEWTHSGAGVNYFELQRKTGAGAYGTAFQYPASTRVVKPAVTDAPGTVITYRVRAVSATAGTSGWSNEEAVTVPATLEASPPVLSQLGYTRAYKDSIRLEIQYTGERTGWAIELERHIQNPSTLEWTPYITASNASLSDWPSYGNGHPNRVMLTATNLGRDFRYQFRVRMTKGAQQTPWVVTPEINTLPNNSRPLCSESDTGFEPILINPGTQAGVVRIHNYFNQ